MVLWKDVPDYEGYYEVSNTGLIRSKNGIRKPQVSWDGYLFVKLCKQGQCRKVKIHRLVALAFIPNPNNLPEINHKDENPANNNVENLEWCDRIYNNNYGTRNARAAIGISKANSKRIKQFDIKRKYIQTFDSVKQASEILNIDKASISKCACGLRLSAGGYVWKYE